MVEDMGLKITSNISSASQFIADESMAEIKSLS
jgi:hypothetical protein